MVTGCVIEEGYQEGNTISHFRPLADILSNCVGIVATAVPIIVFQIAHCEFIVK